MPTFVTGAAPGPRAPWVLVLRQLACCGAPLLIAWAVFGALGWIGALLADPVAVTGAEAVAAGLVLVALLGGGAATHGRSVRMGPSLTRSREGPLTKNPAHTRAGTAGIERGAATTEPGQRPAPVFRRF